MSTFYPNWAGLYSEIYYGAYLHLAEGDYSNGIFERKGRNLKEVGSDTVDYIKFVVDSKNLASNTDDELIVKEFTSLEDAQEDPMDTDVIVYVKDAIFGTPI